MESEELAVLALHLSFMENPIVAVTLRKHPKFLAWVLEEKSWAFKGCFLYSCFSTVRPKAAGTKIQHFQRCNYDFCPSIVIYIKMYGTLRSKLLETRCFMTIRNTDLLAHLSTALVLILSCNKCFLSFLPGQNTGWMTYEILIQYLQIRYAKSTSCAVWAL